MFEELKAKLKIKDVIKIFGKVIGVLFKTGVVKILMEADNIEIFELDGSLVIAINGSNPELVRSTLKPVNEALKGIKAPTSFEGNVITIQLKSTQPKEVFA
ncbi:MAG: hypothetical protein H3Z53_05655 [archaeon]|nr:hypothetical protein [archaeon]MCP8313842.1 hypothetical protein [archaeon]